jgi:hypothetical protein
MSKLGKVPIGMINIMPVTNQKAATRAEVVHKYEPHF